MRVSNALSTEVRLCVKKLVTVNVFLTDEWVSLAMSASNEWVSEHDASKTI